MDGYSVFSSEAECRPYELRLLGTGASAPTKEMGQATTIARTGAGVYTVTFPEYPGNFRGSIYGFDATVPAGLADYSCVGTMTTPTVFTVTVYNAAGAATDLAAAQWLNLTLRFKAGSN